MRKDKRWTKIIIRVLSGEKNIPSPFSEEGKIESVFIVVLKDTKMGYGMIWCSKTHRGIHLSRMQVPDTVNYLFSDEIVNLDHVPQIKFEQIG
ncbi:hypothetical protein F0L74_11730 [Chitinophaga agrisoli]|uniref:Uncharacterized protein n=1 Tax=Chitinophaga agrisoli TaxID=2607653 RepID=A0A5B2VX43_9BACT|nr:hypothetical protein [Chitinophaga agrisoli]KAA2243178.1 hypothetical protein F0L74_11730 [Chitinophaga agrisoli]